MEDFIRVRDIHRMTGISISTLRRWLAAGAGPPYRKTPTGGYLFRQSEVEQWLDSLKQPPSSRPDAT